jgi:hypothetical protein
VVEPGHQDPPPRDEAEYRVVLQELLEVAARRLSLINHSACGCRRLQCRCRIREAINNKRKQISKSQPAAGPRDMREAMANISEMATRSTAATTGTTRCSSARDRERVTGDFPPHHLLLPQLRRRAGVPERP